MVKVSLQRGAGDGKVIVASFANSLLFLSVQIASKNILIVLLSYSAHIPVGGSTTGARDDELLRCSTQEWQAVGSAI